GPGKPSGPVPADPFEIVAYSELPAGKGLPWADQVQEDKENLVLPLDELGSYGVGDYRSETVNIVDGERLTRAPEPCDCDTKEVWFTGASAAFGSGQRDLHTIASQLVRLGDDHGVSLHIRNLAVPGHTLWQEYAPVLARLANGERPDLVVFYDGFNDLSYSFTEGVLGTPDFRVPMVDRPDLQPLQILGLGPGGIVEATEPLGGLEGLGRSAARRYRRLVELVTADVEALGVPVLFVFQPDALTSAVQRAAGFEAPLRGAEGLEGMGDALASMLAVAESELPEGQLNLRHVFDDLSSPVFFDPVHTNEQGAAVVAEAIWPALQAELSPPGP
ncbi:MAG: hypothetical protein JWM47_2025, partial [Acidimicrobiales bacterium]|nr:hypothetical protein [Acidimicrobiales bacterium]